MFKKNFSYIIATKQDMVDYKSIWDDSKLKELRSWQDHDVMTVVEYDEKIHNSENVIQSRFVCTWKQNEKGDRIAKSRLVAKGYQDLDLDKLVVESPTVSKVAQKCFVQLCASNNWKPNKLDLRTAFLQGEKYGPERRVFLVPPSEVAELLSLNPQKKYLLFLKKSAYGLGDAPRAWFKRLSTFLKSCMLEQLSSDSAAFQYKSTAGVEGMVLVYVDDLKIAGTERFLQFIIERIRDEFRIGSEEVSNFKYCGVRLTTEFDNASIIQLITLDQTDYTESLNEIQIPSMKSDTLLTGQLYSAYRKLLGNLSWLYNNTRIDIAYRVNQLSIDQNQPTVRHARALNKILRYAKNTRLSLNYPRMNIGDMELLVFSDSSFANNTDYSSQSGYVIALGTSISENEYRYSILDWKSVKQRRVANSTTASEANALTLAVDSVHYIKRIVLEIFGLQNIRVRVFSDSKNLVKLCNSTKGPTTNSDKRVFIDILSIREQLAENSLSDVTHMNTKLLIADALTKKDQSSVGRLVTSIKHNYVQIRLPVYDCLMTGHRLLPGDRMLSSHFNTQYADLERRGELNEQGHHQKEQIKAQLKNDNVIRHEKRYNSWNNHSRYRKDVESGHGHHSAKKKQKSRTRFKGFRKGLLQEHRRDHFDEFGEVPMGHVTEYVNHEQRYDKSLNSFLKNRRLSKQREPERQSEVPPDTSEKIVKTRSNDTPMITMPKDITISMPKEYVHPEKQSRKQYLANYQRERKRKKRESRKVEKKIEKEQFVDF